jgi:type 1 fimbria pilin
MNYFYPNRRGILNGMGFILVAMASFDTNAVVTCRVLVPTVVFAITAPLNAPRDVPVGKTLSGWVETPLVLTHNNCAFTDQRQAGAGAKATGTYLGTMTDAGTTYEIFKSPTQGVGYILKGKDQKSPYTPIGRNFTTFIRGYSSYYNSQFAIRLVATGEPLVSGPVPSFQVGEFRVSEGTNTSAPAFLSMPPTSVVTRTCTVTTRTVAFQLPEIRTSNLPNIGSVGGSAMRTIQLNCPSASNVRMVISDATTPANRSSTLTLSPDSTAAGVGIQVSYNGNAVLYGEDSSAVATVNQFAIGDNLLGVVSIPLTAQYIRTDANLRAGSVRGAATFTMSYQ